MSSHREDYDGIPIEQRGVRTVAVGTTSTFEPGFVWLEVAKRSDRSLSVNVAHLSPTLARRIARDLIDAAETAENDLVRQQRTSSQDDL